MFLSSTLPNLVVSWSLSLSSQQLRLMITLLATVIVLWFHFVSPLIHVSFCIFWWMPKRRRLMCRSSCFRVRVPCDSRPFICLNSLLSHHIFSPVNYKLIFARIYFAPHSIRSGRFAERRQYVLHRNWPNGKKQNENEREVGICHFSFFLFFCCRVLPFTLRPFRCLTHPPNR